jgi:hypothetical protein
MKKNLFLVLVLVLILIIAFFLFSEKKNDKELLDQSGFSLEASRNIAESWIKEESSTYLHDGLDLMLISEKEVVADLVYSYVYSFQSRSAGYGDRSDQMSAQVITPHQIEIVVESGEVISAINDDIYDEINREMIGIEEDDQMIDELIIE